MLQDGLLLADGSPAINFQIASGSSFPTDTNSVGELFYLTSGATPGLYVYDGTTWVASGGGAGGAGGISGSNISFANSTANLALGNSSGTVGGVLSTPNNAGGQASSLTIVAGNSASATGGAVSVVGGNGSNSNPGGAVIISGGVAGNASSGGAVSLIGGAPTGASSQGGAINLRAGSSSSNTAGGSVSIVAGNGADGFASGAGGDVSVSAGSGGQSQGAGAGGALFLRGGLRGAIGGAAGDIVLFTNNIERFRLLASGALSVGSSVGTSGQVLTSQGGSAVPIWAASSAFDPTTSQIVTGTWQFSNAIQVGTPTVDNHAATKSYVDSVAAGLDPKASVRAATTTNITLSGAQTVDGVALIAGDRILVKDQTTGSQNGIYLVASGAWPRSADFDGTPAAEVSSGAFVFVTQGTTNSASGFVLVTNDPITIGTTVQSWSQFSASGSTSAGSLTGTTLAPNIVASSLTSVGTIITGTWSAGFGAISGANLTTLNASNLTTGSVASARLGSGAATSSTYLRGDGIWAPVVAGAAAAGTLTGTTLASNVVASSLTSVGTITSGTWSGLFGAVSGANLTSLNAAALTTGTTLPSNIVTAAIASLTAPIVSLAPGSYLIIGNTAITGVPTVGTRSAGTRVVFYPSLSGAEVDFAMGVESGAMWTSFQSTFPHKWYMGTTNVMTLSPAGVLSGSFSGTGAGLTALNATNLSSGTVGAARLGSGTADATTFLRGDNTWAVPPIQVAAAGTLSGATLASNVVNSSLTSVGTLGSLSVTGSVTAGSHVGPLTGNASTATILQTARAINGVNFDGSSAITVTAAAVTVTGATLASNVVASSLTSVGILSTLSVSGNVTSSDPTTSSQLATKNYVDNAIAGLTWKTSVIAATTANITLSGAQTVDGVALTAGQRVLVKNQTTTSTNGIYVVAAGAWTRSTDADIAVEVNGAAVYVELGTTNADTTWTEIASVTTVGTDPITFAQLSAAVSVAASSLTGTTLASNVVVSSLTSVGTLGSLAVTGNISAGNFSGTSSGINTGDQTSVSGNAGTATALQIARLINGTSFNGSADITITSAASTLTGATLASNIVTSSLTSLGTITSLSAGTLTITSTLTTGGSTGTSGQVLTSNGASAPTWQAAGSFAGGTIANAITITSAGPQLILGTTAINGSIAVPSVTTGSAVTLTIAAGLTSQGGSVGGRLTLQGGQGTVGTGGVAELIGGAQTSTASGGSGGGAAMLTGGLGGITNGGNAIISGGVTTTGTSGGAIVLNTASTITLVERFRILANGAWSVGATGTDYGTSGQVLTSNGNAVPTWQIASAGTPSTLANSVTFGTVVNGAQTLTGMSATSTGANTLTIQAGSTSSGTPGVFTLQGGTSASGSTAGDIVIRGGANTLSGGGGTASIQGGAGGNATVAGAAYVNGGVGAGGGGAIILQTGTASTLAERFRITNTGAWNLAGVAATAGQVLTTVTAGQAPTWQLPAVGNISGGAANQIPFQSAASTTAFSTKFTFDNALATLTIGAPSNSGSITSVLGTGMTITTAGGAGTIGALTLSAGNSSTVTGGAVNINSGTGSGIQNSGPINIVAGATGSGFGGNIIITAGASTTAANSGAIVFTTNVIERFRILAQGAWSVGTAGTNTGTSGQVLTSTGATTAPTWAAPGPATIVTATASLVPSTTTGTTGVYAGTPGSLPTLWLTNSAGAVDTKISTIDQTAAGLLRFVFTNDAWTTSATWLSAQRGAGVNTAAITLSGTSVSIASPTVALSSAGSMLIIGTTAITGAPTTTTRSIGTRAVFYPSLSGIDVDYAMGVETGAMWTSFQAGFPHKWYMGTTNVMTMAAGTGVLSGKFNLIGELLANGASGTTGQVLTSAGSSAIPTWSAISAGTLTGPTLAAAVTASSLTSVGALNSLSVTGAVSAGTSLAFQAVNTITGIVGNNNLTDTYTFDTNKIVNHYGLTWKSLSDSTSGPSAILSGYGGLRFHTLGVERMRVEGATGAVVIGSPTATPPGTLYLRGATGTRPSLVYENNGINYWNVALKGDAGQNYYQISNSAETVGVYMTTLASGWNNLSDERFKDNWVELTDAATKIKTLRAGTHTWAVDSTLPRDVGLIAQDVQAVLPEAVDASDPDRLGVRYTHVVPLLVKALQEALARIETLEAKVTALQAK